MAFGLQQYRRIDMNKPAIKELRVSKPVSRQIISTPQYFISSQFLFIHKTSHNEEL